MTMPGQLESRWFDGRSPKPHAASLRIEHGELLVQIDAQDVRHYPVRGVRWPERRTHGQRQAELPDGSLLQHADAAEWDAWVQAHGLKDGAVVGWMQSWRTTLIALLGTVVVLAIAWQWGVPWLSQTLAHRMPVAIETHIGEQSLKQLEHMFLRPSQLPQAQQDDLHRRFQALVDRVDSDGAKSPWALSFYASPSLGPNAFALPGGQIVMTDELVKLLHDQPDALVGVFAHELGHVHHRDGLDMVIRASLISALVGLVLGDAGSFIASVPATLAAQAYSRSTERRADAFAARVLDQGALSPAVMVVFFERLRRASSGEQGKDDADDAEEDAEGASLPISIASHPADEERIRFFREWRRENAP